MKKRLTVAVITMMMLVMLLGMNSFAFNNVIGKTGGSGANIRSEASTTGKLIGSLPKNTEFTICGEVKGADGNIWYLVFLNGKTKGYISSVAATNTGKSAGGTTSDNAGNTPAVTPDPTPDPGNEGNGGSNGQGPVTVNEEACRLAALVYGTGKLVPDFSPDIYEYTLTVDESVEKVAIQAMTMDELASIPEDNNIRDLQPGVNERSITVTGADGVSTLTYHIKVVRGSEDLTPKPEPEPVPEKPSDDTPNEDVSNVGGVDDSGVTTTVKSKASLGGYKWLLIGLVFVIVILVMILVYVIIQMRDMRETIEQLNRERRHLRKKIRSAHKISAQEEAGKRTMQSGEADTTYPPQADYAVPTSYEDGAEYEQYPNDAVASEPEEQGYADDASTTEAGEIDYSDPVYRQIAYREEAEAANEREYAAEIYSDATRGVQYAGETDEALEEELEDLEDRDSVGGEATEGDAQKEGWRPMNFLTPDDDMEFEFLDLDEEEK